MTGQRAETCFNEAKRTKSSAATPALPEPARHPYDSEWDYEGEQEHEQSGGPGFGVYSSEFLAHDTRLRFAVEAGFSR